MQNNYDIDDIDILFKSLKQFSLFKSIRNNEIPNDGTFITISNILRVGLITYCDILTGLVISKKQEILIYKSILNYLNNHIK